MPYGGKWAHEGVGVYIGKGTHISQLAKEGLFP